MAAQPAQPQPVPDDAEIAGVVLSFHAMVLTVAAAGTGSSASLVTGDTVVKVGEPGGRFERGSIVHLAPGAVVADIAFDRDTGALRKISVYHHG